MRTDRLNTLADFLESSVPDDRFELYCWSTGDLNSCGTVGCACGWATTIPEFREIGLSLNNHLLCFQGAYNYEAVSIFFDIDYDNATYLFAPDEYCIPTKTAVIDRIREFVKENNDES